MFGFWEVHKARLPVRHLRLPQPSSYMGGRGWNTYYGCAINCSLISVGIIGVILWDGNEPYVQWKARNVLPGWATVTCNFLSRISLEGISWVRSHSLLHASHMSCVLTVFSRLCLYTSPISTAEIFILQFDFPLCFHHLPVFHSTSWRNLPPSRPRFAFMEP